MGTKANLLVIFYKMVGHFFLKKGVVATIVGFFISYLYIFGYIVLATLCYYFLIYTLLFTY